MLAAVFSIDENSPAGAFVGQLDPVAVISADFDADQDIDGADLLIWQRGAGTTSGAVRGTGDANGDGDVDAADQSTCRAQFGLQSVGGQLGLGLNYAIVAGNVGGAFVIRGSGRIDVQTAGALDFEINPRFDLSVHVTSASGISDFVAVQINLNDVDEGPSPVVDFLRPVVVASANTLATAVGGQIQITISASDDVGVTMTELLVNGATVPLAPVGPNLAGTFSSAEAGLFVAVARAADAAGNVGQAQLELRFLTPGDATPPQVSIATPSAGSMLTETVDVVGTVTDNVQIIGYKLEYSQKGTNQFVAFAQGAGPVVAGVLGAFNASALKNGLYDVRLTAEDASGNVAVATTVYEVDGAAKAGNFTLAFVDLTVPVTGIPITLTRSYDSRVKTSGDFGVGWSLGLSDFRIAKTNSLADGWMQFRGSGPFGLPRHTMAATQSNVIRLTLPDGRRETFVAQVTPSSQLIEPIQFAEVSYAPTAGTTSQLFALADNFVFVTGYNGASSPVELLDSSTFFPYNPTRWLWIREDGTKFVINEGTGVESIMDPNGNAITIGPQGITHSGGQSVAIERDAAGRITEIVDPNGQSLHYAYDAYGDLISVTDRVGAVTRFVYDADHNLTKVVDPLGRLGIRSQYDDQGRLISVTDALGNVTTVALDAVNRRQTVTDSAGMAMVYEYDARGNVVRETDAMGGVLTRTFDADDNVLTETDPLGRTTTFTYDAMGNVLTQIDPLGHATTFTYDAHGRMLTETDPLGRTHSYVYDSAGNLLTETNPLGHVTTTSYDAAGNPLTITDPTGAVTAFTYDTFGRVLAQTDALGAVTSYAYDANGNRLSETRARTTPTGPQSLVTTFVYDANGRVTSTINSLGAASQTAYDAVGRVIARIDALGHRIDYEYDARGKLVETTYPNGTTDAAAYDSLGRTVATTDRAGRVTQYLYDALGRQTHIIYPDGAEEETVLDAAGQTTAQIDPLGRTMQYLYDAAGRLVASIDPLGHATARIYDAAGQLTAATDPLGRTTTFAYDAAGRQVTTTFADGSSTSSSYDNAGRVTTATDQLGRATHYEYDLRGRLTAVVDALAQRTEYAYDEVGNLVIQRDANGRETRYEFDAAARRTATVLPMGQRSTMAYDAAGRLVSTTDFNGATISYAYDSLSRLTAKTFPDSSAVTWTYTATDQRASVTDARGVTTYQYDIRDRLIGRQDADGVAAIHYAYDLAGNRTSVTTSIGAVSQTTTYSYDALDRLAGVSDPFGGTTGHTYDAASNLVQTALPNGVVETRQYDSRNRLVSIVARNAANIVLSGFNYTLDAAGKRTRVVEHSGRAVDYAFDALGRLTQEAIADAAAGNRTIGYVYDPVGNRLSRADSVEGVTTYAYDNNDRLLAETRAAATTTYSYDDNGNTLSKATAVDQAFYEWDVENRLIAADTNGDGASDVEYRYDADGMRVSSTDAAGEVRSLIDANLPYAQVLVEYTPAAVIEASYVHGLDLILQHRVDGAVRSYYLVDALGSTRALTDAAAAVTDRYVYDAYGRLLHQTGATENSFLFAGEQRDSAVGLDYLRARYMNPATGLFLSRDAFPPTLWNPLTLHRYAYAGGNPVMNIDPRGQQFTLASISVSLSVQSSLSSIQLAFAQAGLEAVSRTARIACGILEPAMQIRQMGVDLLLAGNDSGYELISLGTELYVSGLREIRNAIVNIYVQTAKELLNSVKISVDFGGLLADVFNAFAAPTPKHNPLAKKLEDYFGKLGQLYVDVLKPLSSQDPCEKIQGVLALGNELLGLIGNNIEKQGFSYTLSLIVTYG